VDSILNNNTQKWLQQAREAGLSDMKIQQQLKAAGLDEMQINKLLVKGYVQQAEKQKIPEKSELIVRAGSLPNIILLIKEAWNIFKSRFRKFFLLSIIMLFLGLVIAFVYFVIGSIVIDFGYMTPFDLGERGFIASLIEIFVLFLFFTGSWVIAALILSWLQAAFILTIHNKDASLNTISNRSFKILFSFWWINLLISFFIGGAFNLLIIPCILFYIWFSMSIFILVTENIPGMQSLLKSKEYVSGYWWEVLGRQLVIIILISIPLLIVFYFFQFIGIKDFGAWLVLIIIPFLIPLGICYNYALYRQLRYIKGKNIPVLKEKTGLVFTAIIGWAIMPLIIIFLTGGIF